MSTRRLVLAVSFATGVAATLFAAWISAYMPTWAAFLVSAAGFLPLGIGCGLEVLWRDR